MTIHDGRVLNVVRLVDHGPANRRFNLVILGDGFLEGDLPSYRRRVESQVVLLSRRLPFVDFWALINVFMLEVISTDAGMGVPGEPPRKTFFDAKTTGTDDQAYLRADEALVHLTCQQTVSQYHFPLLFVNDSRFRAATSQDVSVVPIEARFLLETVEHELGHLFGLADEYDEKGDGTVYTLGAEPPQVNVTTVTDLSTVKWKRFVTATSIVVNLDCSKPSDNEEFLAAGQVGIFEGANLFHCGLHRPAGRCKMRDHTRDTFCPVCLATIRAKLSTFRPVAEETFRRTDSDIHLGAAFTLPDGPHVLLYSRSGATGELLQVLPKAIDVVSKSITSVMADCTSIVPLPLLGGMHVLMHDAASGRTEIAKIAPDASTITTVFPTQWTTGWTVMTSLAIGTRTFLFSYKLGPGPEAGRAAIDLIAEDGTNTLTTFDVPFLEFGFTAFAGIDRTFPLSPGSRAGGGLLAGYKASGEVVIFLVDELGTWLREVARIRTLPAGTSFVPVVAHGNFVLAVYDGHTGRGEVRWVYASDAGVPPNPLGPDSRNAFRCSELGSTQWSDGWTVFLPFILDDATHWLAHRPRDGTTVLERVD